MEGIATTETGIVVRKETAIELPTNLKARTQRGRDLPGDFAVVERLLLDVAPGVLDPHAPNTDYWCPDIVWSLADGVPIPGTRYVVGYDEERVYVWVGEASKDAEKDKVELRVWLDQHGVPTA
jgi:hypothetical protein